ncbi:uncharacterized protein LOC104581524 [Brachypodium distachyon]|uniref:Uncharacterized protein n=1 Tax=Brachypodium distachyon TaxID=15368 RepID=A0A0Q3K0W1_BRADI|nr:uncharacterized protein LOC104581524 [Brachypodium distachyon]KQK17796.1 hypothetical protein BRADI_1g36812v3 [Brachypodium distachyon]KQK17797.1 hypothetical protein BRADI_1g36812v3 [Brachypodium distachyon]KQK17798.1 hypothetical protein BRADI_1g36812v3 [Brachypodium distachyon]KQK17799.1 hypothetical protein BRADI_1g36812v3 [Brachypodium distachyon]PNT75703.1 hypothetical protein BRADI_1g36812v3 [Brachypodium distachyon]|eukprot:XP_024316581.1 uncharacterized protein LOC104581524 [Brachypodium distachyon]
MDRSDTAPRCLSPPGFITPSSPATTIVRRLARLASADHRLPRPTVPVAPLLATGLSAADVRRTGLSLAATGLPVAAVGRAGPSPILVAAGLFVAAVGRPSLPPAPRHGHRGTSRRRTALVEAQGVFLMVPRISFFTALQHSPMPSPTSLTLQQAMWLVLAFEKLVIEELHNLH